DPGVVGQVLRFRERSSQPSQRTLARRTPARTSSRNGTPADQVGRRIASGDPSRANPDHPRSVPPVGPMSCGLTLETIRRQPPSSQPPQPRLAPGSPEGYRRIPYRVDSPYVRPSGNLSYRG